MLTYIASQHTRVGCYGSYVYVYAMWMCGSNSTQEGERDLYDIIATELYILMLCDACCESMRGRDKCVWYNQAC